MIFRVIKNWLFTLRLIPLIDGRFSGGNTMKGIFNDREPYVVK